MATKDDIRISITYDEQCTNLCSSYLALSKEQLDAFDSYDEFYDWVMENYTNNGSCDDTDYGDIDNMEITDVESRDELDFCSMEDIEAYFQNRETNGDADNYREFNGQYGFAPGPVVVTETNQTEQVVQEQQSVQQ